MTPEQCAWMQHIYQLLALVGWGERPGLSLQALPPPSPSSHLSPAPEPLFPALHCPPCPVWSHRLPDTKLHGAEAKSRLAASPPSGRHLTLQGACVNTCWVNVCCGAAWAIQHGVRWGEVTCDVWFCRLRVLEIQRSLEFICRFGGGGILDYLRIWLSESVERGILF